MCLFCEFHNGKREIERKKNHCEKFCVSASEYKQCVSMKPNGRSRVTICGIFKFDQKNHC